MLRYFPMTLSAYSRMRASDAAYMSMHPHHGLSDTTVVCEGEEPGVVQRGISLDS